MSYPYLTTDKRNGVAIVSISRPETLNALDGEGLQDLIETIVDLRDASDVNVIILTGTGTSFVAGADIAYMKDLSEAEAKRFIELGHAVCSLIEETPKIVIAAVNGYALGGGIEIAMACDLIYASEDASFGQPEVRLGIIPGFGGSQRLPRLIGRNAAKEWILTGDVHGAEQAKELGLVNEVVPPDQLLPRALEIAAKIAAAGPTAVANAKLCINVGMELALSAGLELEKEAFLRVFNNKDRVEGMLAFIEKRRARFE